MVIQDGARGLLVPAADYHRVGGRHRHGTHADGVHVGRPIVDANGMILRHGGHHNVLHDLAEFTRYVWVQLIHLHSWHSASLAHIANHDLLVAALMIQL